MRDRIEAGDCLFFLNTQARWTSHTVTISRSRAVAPGSLGSPNEEVPRE